MLFMQENNPLSLTEFSKKLSIPKTTILGIVNTLLELKYLEKDPVSSKYRLGPLLFQLGMRYASNMDMFKIAKVWMERLSLKFKEPVLTGILVNDKVVVMFRVESEGEFATFPLTGTPIPTHTTCIGKIIMAYMEKSKRVNLLNNYEYKSITENSITSKEQFEKELEKVKMDGLSFDNEESLAGKSGIGGGIFNYAGQVIAGFAVSGKSENINRQRDLIIKEVKHTSREVSTYFGYVKQEPE